MRLGGDADRSVDPGINQQPIAAARDLGLLHDGMIEQRDGDGLFAGLSIEGFSDPDDGVLCRQVRMPEVDLDRTVKLNERRSHRGPGGSGGGADRKRRRGRLILSQQKPGRQEPCQNQRCGERASDSHPQTPSRWANRFDPACSRPGAARRGAGIIDGAGRGSILPPRQARLDRSRRGRGMRE
jgi:hypothetical protein